MFNKQQQAAINIFKSGRSFFLSGPAGTGKSFLLQHFRQIAAESKRTIAVTATTGVAAQLVQGRTLHAWAGIGLGRGETAQLVRRVMRNRASRERWQKTNILVIDECSMLSSAFLDRLDQVARSIRRCAQPMGGLQVIFVGDMYQLGPVDRKQDEDIPDFAFTGQAWKQIVGDRVVQLQQVYRQEDPEFIECLMEIREGRVSEKTDALFRSRLGLEAENEWGVWPTRLYPVNNVADRVNMTQLERLPGPSIAFEATRHFVPTPNEDGDLPTAEEVAQWEQQLDERSPYVTSLELRVGAQVMMLANDYFAEHGLVNGSCGKVVSFDAGRPVVRFANGTIITVPPRSWDIETPWGVMEKSQVPLRLAWAYSIHRSQGSTLDLASIDVGGRIFEAGQTYVALSRVRTLQGIYLTGWDPAKVRAHPAVVAFYAGLKKDDHEEGV